MAQPTSGIPASLHPRNHLSWSLSPKDFIPVELHLQPFALGMRLTLEESNKPINDAYFPESDFESVVAISSRNHLIEVGIIGGMV